MTFVVPTIVFNVAAVVLTISILVVAVRQPLKKKYHYYFFGVLVAGICAFTAVGIGNSLILFNISGGVSVFWIHVQSEFLALFLAFVCGFAVYFVSPKLSPFQKFILIAAFGTFLVRLALGAFLDPNYQYRDPCIKTVSLGCNPTPGNLYQYFDPFGFDIIPVLFGVLIFAYLARFYLSQRSPFTRTQTLYLIAGILILVVDQPFGPKLNLLTHQSFFLSTIWIIGSVVLIVGIRRRGFYGVVPVAETAPSTEVAIPLENSRSYLAKNSEEAFAVFSNLVKNGRNGLCITRTFPESVRETYGLKTTPIRWLADAKGPDTIPPDDLLGISLTVKDFMERASKPVVLLHGLEFLVSRDGFASVQRMVQGLTEANATSRGLLLLPLTPRALDEKEEAQLAAETLPLPQLGGN